MSFVKADVKAVEAENSEIQQTMCQAHGCPNRWMINDAKGRLCRWHHYAEPMDWPSITSQLRLGLAPTTPKPQPMAPSDSNRVRTAMAEFKSFGSGRADKTWAYRLKEREEAGERLSVAQRNAWRTALRMRNDEE